MKTVEANGASIPSLGFGTWEINGPKGRDIVAEAVEIGYRHFDTAAGYDNERDVGAGLRSSGNRDALFVTTKVWPTNFATDKFRDSVKNSVDRLDIGAVDLLLLHWPNPQLPMSEPVDGLNWAVQEGYARHVGVSNFTCALLDEAVALSEAPLVANQIEYHPFLDQSKVLAACRKHGLAVTAYCPIARGRVFGNPVMERIAAKHGKTPGQIALRWLVQQNGVVAIPRTSNSGRARENAAIFDFHLSETEMNAIRGLADRNGRLVPDAEIREGHGLQAEDGHAAAPFVPDWDLAD